MKEIEKIEFDELDQKVFEEMPILISTLAATQNRISRLLNPMYEDLKEVVGKKISPHKFWKIRKDQKQFHPLANYNYSNTTKIVQLENYFDLDCYFEIHKTVKGKTKNHLCVKFGYWFEKNEEQDQNCFYFQIFKWDDYEKYGGVLADFKFYEKIKSKIKSKVKDVYIEITHPEKTDDSVYFCFEIPDLNAQKISNAYEVFKKEVVLPAVTKILRQ